jgi:hypothetical protein
MVMVRLAVALLEARGFTQDDFARRTPPARSAESSCCTSATSCTVATVPRERAGQHKRAIAEDA